MSEICPSDSGGVSRTEYGVDADHLAFFMFFFHCLKGDGSLSALAASSSDDDDDDD